MAELLSLMVLVLWLLLSPTTLLFLLWSLVVLLVVVVVVVVVAVLVVMVVVWVVVVVLLVCGLWLWVFRGGCGGFDVVEDLIAEVGGDGVLAHWLGVLGGGLVCEL